MNLLLDTHTFVWWVSGETIEIGARALPLIEDPDNVVFVSAASAYEIVFKHRKGLWPDIALLAADVAGEVEAADFTELPVGFQHMQIAGNLVEVHRDPFDRIFAAQALTGSMPILSADRKLDQFGVQRIW